MKNNLKKIFKVLLWIFHIILLCLVYYRFIYLDFYRVEIVNYEDKLLYKEKYLVYAGDGINDWIKYRGYNLKKNKIYWDAYQISKKNSKYNSKLGIYLGYIDREILENHIYISGIDSIYTTCTVESNTGWEPEEMFDRIRKRICTIYILNTNDLILVKKIILPRGIFRNTFIRGNYLIFKRYGDENIYSIKFK